MPDQTRSTVDLGNELERQVAACYEALGFRVERNANVDGHQIDVLVSRHTPGAGIVTYALEVKYRSKGAMGVNAVSEFIVTARDLIGLGHISGAAMVSNVGYSADAKGKVIGNKTIRLLTLSDLEGEIFSTSEALFRCCTDYERQSIIGEYIPLPATSSGSVSSIPDAAGFLLDWAGREDGLMTLVGDFGSGKTTVMDRLFYMLAKTRIKTGATRYPIQLRLRGLLNHGSLWSFVSSSLRDSQYITTSQSIFNSMLQAGEFVVLLDGFDEIHTGATAADRGRYLAHLLELIGSPSPCILSTRPTYFSSFREMDEMFRRLLEPKTDFQRLEKSPVDPARLLERFNFRPSKSVSTASLRTALELSPLQKEDIVRYLGNFEAAIATKTGADVEAAFSFLESIYDIKDLMTRPLLLNMVVVTVVEGNLDTTDRTASIGPSTLYDLYTQICSKRDEGKKTGRRGGQFLSPGIRLAACRELAISMLRKGAIELTSLEVETAIDRVAVPGIKAKQDGDKREFRERCVTDIRSCSFLRSAEDDGMLRFAHKSYFEFFVAQYFLLEVRHRLPAIAELARENVTREIVGFLGSYIRDNATFAKDLDRAFHNQGGDEATNSLYYRIILASGLRLSQVRFKKTSVHDVELKRTTVQDASFSQCQFARVEIDRVTATSWTLDQSTMTDCTIQDSSFYGSDLSLRGSRNVLSRLRFEDCRMEWHGDSWDAEDVHFNDGSLLLNMAGCMRQISLNSQNVLIGPEADLKIASTVEMTDCVVSQGATGVWCSQASCATLTNCILLGVAVGAQDVLTPANAAIRLVRCKGVILTSGFPPAKGAGVSQVHLLGSDVWVVDADFLEDALKFRSAPQSPSPSNDTPLSKKIHREEAERRVKAADLLDRLKAMKVLQEHRDELSGFLQYVFKPKEFEMALLTRAKARSAKQPSLKTH